MIQPITYFLAYLFSDYKVYIPNQTWIYWLQSTTEKNRIVWLNKKFYYQQYVEQENIFTTVLLSVL